MRDFGRVRGPLGGKSRFGVAMTALALVHGAPAYAQETSAAAASNEAAPGDQIIVTGSRVARDGFQAPTPLVVLTQQDIQNTSPSNNIADFVNQLPQLAGSTKPGNSRLNISNGSAGINALNMRNLGESRVLVLVDGRRSVGSTIFGWVDINTIPQALVERVEVVTGGASSAYGSDAVTGVVNFVLNKKMEGLRISGDIGLTDKGDGSTIQAASRAACPLPMGAAMPYSTPRSRTRTAFTKSTRATGRGTTRAILPLPTRPMW